MAELAEADRVALYTHLRTFESDFDKSQSQMRAISSAWTGAVLAAIALLITTAATPIAVPQGGTLKPDGLIEVRADSLAYLRAVICFVGSAGVLAFWYVDQGIYQRLLHSAFAYGLFVEANQPELPQVRSAMFLANLDVTNRLGIFYRAQYYLFVVISVVIYWISGSIAHNPTGVLYVIVPHFILAILCDLISLIPGHRLMTPSETSIRSSRKSCPAGPKLTRIARSHRGSTNRLIPRCRPS